MTEGPFEPWETHIQEIANRLPYPPTPDIAGQVSRRLRDQRFQPLPYYRKVVWAAAVMLILLVGAMLVPPVRAAVIEFLQIGVVRIFLGEDSPGEDSPGELAPSPTPTQETGSIPGFAATIPIPTQQPTATPTDLVSLLELGGETSLEKALTGFNHPLHLPSYPPDLGEPDRVFLQDGEMVILVWTRQDDPEQIELSLHEIGPDSWAVTKMGPEIIQETSVGGRPAFWASGPYPVRLANGNMEIVRLVVGSVLIWEQDGITYRLESTLDPEEAIKIAESLRPYAP